MNIESRFAISPTEAKQFDTQALREHFLITDIFQTDIISFVYTFYDRYMVGGVTPINKPVQLETVDALKSDFFLQRRELGVINIGGPGRVSVDDQVFDIDFKEALYLGRGAKHVIFESASADNPAKFYLNSTPAHTAYPHTKVGKNDGVVLEMGAKESANERIIRQLIVNNVVQTCQLQMGVTTLASGSIWNTMPAHQHDRRMEAYLYFDMEKDNAVAHFCGEPQETRVIWTQSEQAIISPPWSIHCGAGTARYSFVWGMAGENLDYDDMDKFKPTELR